MTDSLVVVLERLAQVLEGYAVVSSTNRSDKPHVLITVDNGSRSFEFADSPSAIIRHVSAFAHPPLWDPRADSEDDGRWRLFSVHIEEAIEMADSDERILVLVEGAVSSRRSA
jgi:hypothetical protein